MRKIFLILMFSIVVLNGCSMAEQPSNNKDSATYYIESAQYISNQLTFSVLETGAEPVPIKSFEIMEKSENTDVEIELVKIDKDTLPKNIKSDMFKFKDLNKYSFIRFNFKTDKISQKYDDNYICEYFAKLKVEYYDDELLDSRKKGTYLSSSKNYISYNFLDVYNGKTTQYVIDIKKELEKFKDKNKEIIIKENLNQIRNSMIKELFDTNPAFTKLANDLSEKMTGLSAEDKARVIYDYICENIKYNKERQDDFNIKTSTLDTNKIIEYISIRKTLETKEGTCQDFAYLFDALATYNNLTARIAVGKSNDGNFHAWNRVYDFENNKRILVDCTFGTLDKENNFVVIYPKQDTQQIEFFKEHLIWNDQANAYTTFMVN